MMAHTWVAIRGWLPPFGLKEKEARNAKKGERRTYFNTYTY